MFRMGSIMLRGLYAEESNTSIAVRMSALTATEAFLRRV
jgi:hypothetical protein